jgi:hypothetical protein
MKKCFAKNPFHHAFADDSISFDTSRDMAVCQNLVHLVNIKIAGKWMFIPLKMVLIGIDPYPYQNASHIPHLTAFRSFIPAGLGHGLA